MCTAKKYLSGLKGFNQVVKGFKGNIALLFRIIFICLCTSFHILLG